MNAPLLVLNDYEAYPIDLSALTDVTVQENDVLTVQGFDGEDFGTAIIDVDITLDAAAIAAGEVSITGLSDRVDPDVTTFRARISRSGETPSDWSNYVKHGDLTPATITNDLTPTATEGEIMPTFTLAADMGVSAWHFEGDHAHLFALDGNELTLQETVDFEVRPEYRLRIRCTNYADVDTWEDWVLSVTDVDEATASTLYTSYPYPTNNITFSNGNLTVQTNVVNSSAQHRLRTNQKRSGNRYWEVITGNLARTNDLWVGVCPIDLDLTIGATGSTNTGAPGAGSAVFTSLGQAYNSSGTNTGTNSSFDWTTGERMGFCYNETSNKLWRRTSTGWDGDPEAGTGGLAAPDFTDGYFIYLGVFPILTGQTDATLVTQAADFAFPIPSGYSAFN